MRPPGTAQELERRRRRAVRLVREGHSLAEAGRRVGASRSSVHAWKEAARRGGPKALAAKPHPGRPRRLTAAQHRKLEKRLLAGARAAGFPDELWTAPRVAEVIRRDLGVRYHPDHVRKILVERLGWTAQKPERRARERDEAEIERWRREEFPRIKRGRLGGAPIWCFSTNRASRSRRRSAGRSPRGARRRSFDAGTGTGRSRPSAPSP